MREGKSTVQGYHTTSHLRKQAGVGGQVPALGGFGVCWRPLDMPSPFPETHSHVHSFGKGVFCRHLEPVGKQTDKDPLPLLWRFRSGCHKDKHADKNMMCKVQRKQRVGVRGTSWVRAGWSGQTGQWGTSTQVGAAHSKEKTLGVRKEPRARRQR